MADLLDTLRKNSLSSEECETLIEKCQYNGWLMRGGYDWQDDPYLEEYPYEFARLDNLNDLREYFSYGNWAIRQGVVYKDLAFIQQVNGGDEWWTLKQVDDGWLDFENISFEGTVEDPDSFDHLICSMVAASPQACHDLDYLESQESLSDKATCLKDARAHQPGQPVVQRDDRDK